MSEPNPYRDDLADETDRGERPQADESRQRDDDRGSQPSARNESQSDDSGGGAGDSGGTTQPNVDQGFPQGGGQGGGGQQQRNSPQGGRQEGRNGRRHRRGRGRGPRRDQGGGGGQGGGPQGQGGQQQQQQQQQGPITVVATSESRGWFDPSRDGGYIRRAGSSYLAETGDAWVPPHVVRQYGLRRSDLLIAGVGNDPRGRAVTAEIR